MTRPGRRWRRHAEVSAERDTRQVVAVQLSDTKQEMVFQQIDMNNLHSHFHLIVLLLLFLLLLRLRFLFRSLRFAAVAFFEGQ